MIRSLRYSRIRLPMAFLGSDLSSWRTRILIASMLLAGGLLTGCMSPSQPESSPEPSIPPSTAPQVAPQPSSSTAPTGSVTGTQVATIAPVAPQTGSSTAPAGSVTGTQVVTIAPATFAMAFKQGARPDTVSVVENGQTVPSQVDPLATWPDGSLKLARITLLKAGTFDLVPASAPATPGVAPPLPAVNFQVSVTLPTGTVYTGTLKGMKGGYGYQGTELYSVTGGPLLYIYSLPPTPLQTANGAPAPYLSLAAWIWYYPKLKTTEIVATIGNDWAQSAIHNVPTADIQFTLNGSVAYTQKNVTIYRWSRTRPIRLWTGAPVSNYAKRDLAYLRATGLVPNYDPALQLSATAVSDEQTRYNKSSRGLMGNTLVTASMPEVGGRGDIGPIPQWDTFALLTNNPAALTLSTEVDDSSAVWPIHVVDQNTGRPISITTYPLVNTIPTVFGRTNNPILCWKNNCTIVYPKRDIPYDPDSAHQPGMNYVPYLLTGDPYYLGEMIFWNNYNCLNMSPAYRHDSKCIFISDHGHNEIRGEAWDLRTLGYLTSILPSNSYYLTFTKSVIANNLASFKQWIANPIIPSSGKTTPMHIVIGENISRAIAPWMDDFFTWAVGNMVRLGYAQWEGPLDWKAQFVITRMQSTNICPSFASAYRAYYLDSKGNVVPDWRTMVAIYLKTYLKSNVGELLNLPCNNPTLLKASRVTSPKDFSGYPWSPDGFPANMQPALAAAVDSRIPGATQAWTQYQARPTKQDYSAYPNWDIVP